MIREGTFEDIPAVIKIIRDAHPNSDYKFTPFDEDETKRNLRLLINSKTDQLWVAVKDGAVVGACGGVTAKVFLSRAYIATTLFTIVADDGRGEGLGLYRAYIEWATKQPRVMEVTVAYTSGMGDQDRVEALFKALDFERTGSTWTLSGAWRYRSRDDGRDHQRHR